jgi:hypothetical protein
VGRAAKGLVAESRALAVVDAASPQFNAPRRQEGDSGKIEPSLLKKEASAADKSQTVEVQIWLTDATPQALAQLKKLGFVESSAPKVAKIRTGRIRLDKLAELAAMPEVTLIAPAPAAR